MIIEAVQARNQADAVDLLGRFFADGGFATPPARIAGNLAGLLADPACWAALAFIDGAAVGVVTVTSARYVEWGRLGEIGDLYVRVSHRRRGVARALVAAAVDWCVQADCSAVSITITPAGEARCGLAAFYAHLGFAPTGRTAMIRPLAAPRPA